MVDINGHMYDILEQYFNETKRKLYITPSNFIELVKVYIQLMKNQ
jgi:hypothetical protein